MGPMERAFLGQFFTHWPHLMQVSRSMLQDLVALSTVIALTGHFLAQMPQYTQPSPKITPSGAGSAKERTFFGHLLMHLPHWMHLS